MRKHTTRTKGMGRKISLMAVPSVFLATAAFADAAGGSGSGSMSPLMIVFLAFIGVFVVMQLIPAMAIFGSLVSAILKKTRKTEESAPANERV